MHPYALMQSISAPARFSSSYPLGGTPLGLLLLRISFASATSSLSDPSPETVAQLILQQRSPAGALRTFRWASNLSSFSHDASTYRALLRALVSFRRFDAAVGVLAQIRAATGCPPDDDTFVAVIRSLARAGMPLEAIKIVDLAASPHFGTGKPSLKVLNSVLNVLVAESIDLARDFYRNKMVGDGVHGDEYTLGILMKGLCRTNRIAEAFKLLSLMKARGVVPNTVIYNTLIHALCRNGKVGRARSVMGEMASPSDVTFNILISAYCGDGNLVQALIMLEKCFNLSLVPDMVSVTKVVEVLCAKDRCVEAAEVMERVERRGGVLDVVGYNALIDGFCKQGKPDVGRRVVKDMEYKGCLPNLRTYNVLIYGFCSVKKIDMGIDMFNEMKQDGIAPNFETFDTIIRGCCSAGRVEDGMKFLRMMEEEIGEVPKAIGPYNSIMYGFYRENRLEEAHAYLEKMGEVFPKVFEQSKKIFECCEEGMIEEAMEIYEQMVGEGGIPCVLVYTCLIDGLSREGELQGAFTMMNGMLGRGYIPMISTFNSLINGFCVVGKWKSALKLLDEMVCRGCLPNLASYSSIIEVLCREGNLQKASDILVGMMGKGLHPDTVLWESLVLCINFKAHWSDNQLTDGSLGSVK